MHMYSVLELKSTFTTFYYLLLSIRIKTLPIGADEALLVLKREGV